ncbi:ribosome-recycling factor [Blattabacterium cuenoti]
METLNEILFSCKKEMNNSFEKFKEEINRIRLGGKSISDYIGKIKVKCYGTYVPLWEISNITVVDNMNIHIHPWDRSNILDIEKFMIEANLGFMITNKGEYIHIHIPILTEETRKNILKKIKIQTEEEKISIRIIRKKNNRFIKKLNFSDDEKKKGEIQIQKTTNEFIRKIDDFFLHKKENILKI